MRTGRESFTVTDKELLQKHHKFLREDQDEKPNYRPNNDQYGDLLAKKYYDKLYKEYVIVDLSMFQEGRIGCRWRTEQEVLANKGDTVCGSKRCTSKSTEAYQINFAYEQQGQRKNALVKVKVCGECSLKLNYKKCHVKIEE